MNPTSSHGQDNKGQPSFFSQKAEKLATAVYMITDIIDAREPLRWKIREEAMEVLSLMSMETGDASSRWNVLYRVTQAIERILQILTLARNTKLISSMNATIVSKEYTELKEKVSTSWGEAASEHVPKLNHQFFKVEALPAPTPKSFPQVEGREQIKRTFEPRTESIGQTAPIAQKNFNQTYSATLPIQRDIQSVIQPSEGKTRENKTDRRSVILALLRTKPEVSVSDAMKEFPGVSDKTVQRELVAMVEAGILIKKGEKRWSTYSIRS